MVLKKADHKKNTIPIDYNNFNASADADKISLTPRWKYSR